MPTDESGDSLAERAAAWIPPWARRRAEPEEPEEPEEEAGAAAPEAATSGSDPGATAAGPDPRPVSWPVGPGSEAEPEAVGPDRATESAVAGPDPVAESAVVGPDRATEADLVEAGPVGESVLALIDDAELRGALEAILLVVNEPVGEATLAQVLEQPADRIGAALRGLAGAYAGEGRGFELRRAAGGWRLYTHPAYARYVERFVLDGQQLRLTQAALETLAVVAYKQPVTRSRVSAIRGVNCDGVIRTLISRGLVEECGAEPDSGAFLYRTTILFLEKLGLDSVDELPPLAPFLPDDVDGIADAEH